MARNRYEEETRPICTWLTRTQLEHFRAVARANNVSPAAYLKAMIVDVLAEESGRVPIPRRTLQGDVFSLLRKPGTTQI